jgi:hypothetical protein
VQARESVPAQERAQVQVQVQVQVQAQVQVQVQVQAQAQVQAQEREREREQVREQEQEQEQEQVRERAQVPAEALERGPELTEAAPVPAHPPAPAVRAGLPSPNRRTRESQVRRTTQSSAASLQTIQDQS